MTFAEYCYGPLEDVLAELEGDNPPTDPRVLRVIIARCVRETIWLRQALTGRVNAA